MKTSILLKFYLSKNFPEFQIGSLLEDNLNYTKEHLYPQEIIEGYNHQQYISSILVNHPAYLKSEQLLDCTHRKNSIKIIPMFYDHFLRSNWDQLSKISFHEFYNNLIINVNKNQNFLPYKYKRMLGYIYKQNWYNELQTIGGTHWIMRQQTKRFTYNVSLETSINSLIENYTEHKNNFFEVLPVLEKASYDFINSKVKMVLSA